MAYDVKNYMIREVSTVDTDISILDAAKVIASDKQYEGYVIVLDKGSPVGIVTERDIINRALAKELDLVKTKISEIMSSPLKTVDPDADLLDASKLMRENNVRKLVVMRNGIIYGVITAKEIALRCGEYVDRATRDILQWTTTIP